MSIAGKAGQRGQGRGRCSKLGLETKSEDDKQWSMVTF